MEVMENRMTEDPVPIRPDRLDSTDWKGTTFVKKFEGGDFLILLLYLDDMLIVGRDQAITGSGSK